MPELENSNLAQIKLNWEGPFNFEEINSMQNELDYGVYQVYGDHKIYGKNVLLYIGQANDNKFGVRMPRHEEWWGWSENNITMYLGRIEGAEHLDNETWKKQIHCVEAALIKYCQPSWNSSGLNGSKKLDIDCEIVNNFRKGSLPSNLFVKNKNIYENLK